MSGSKQGTTVVAEVEQTKEARKAGKFLSIWQQRIDGIKQKGTSTFGKLEEGGKSFFGKVDTTDVMRRVQRLKELIDDNIGDERFESNCITASGKLKDFQTRLKTAKKSALPDIYKEAGEATETLLHAIETLGKAEKTGAKTAPIAQKTIGEVETILAKGKMTDDQRSAFAKRLSGVKKGLIAVGLAGKKEVAQTISDVEEAAIGLLKDIQGIVTGHDKQTKALLLRGTELAKRLSAPIDESLLEKRVAIQVLLQKGDAAVFNCLYEEAKKQFDEAEENLNQLKIPTGQQLDETYKPALIQLAVDAEREEWNATHKGYFYTTLFQQNADTMPEPVRAMWDQGRKLEAQCVDQLDSVELMLRKKQGSPIAAQRLLDSAIKLRGEAKQLFEDAADYMGDSKSEGDSDRAKELNAAAEKIRERLDKLKKDCAKFYKELDKTAKPDGIILAAALRLEKELTEAREKAVTAKDIDSADFLDRIAELHEQLETAKESLEKGEIGPEDLKFEQQIVACRAAIERLRTASAKALEANSDAAIKLKLSTLPAVLQKGAEELIADQSSKRGATEDVENRINELLVRTNQINELAQKAEGVTGAGPEALVLKRKQCREEAAKYAKRLELVKTKLDGKLFSTDENNALIKYGAALQSDLDKLMSPLGSNDISVLTDISNALAKFAARVLAYEARGAGKKNDPSLPKFSQVAVAVQDLKDELGHSLFATREEEIKDILKTVTDIDAKFDQLDPVPTLKTLGELQKKLADAKLKASKEHEEAEAGCKILTEKRKELEKALKAEVKLPPERADNYERYYGDLIFRFRQLKLDIRGKDKLLDPEKAAYDLLLEEAKKALARDPKACGQGEKSAGEKDDKIEEAAARLNELREVNLRLLKEKAAKMPKHEQTELNKQIKEITKSISTAEKTLQDKRDPVAATEVTDAIAKRLNRMADSPLGNSTRGRNNLGKVEPRWKKAVASMLKALNELPDHVIAEGGDTQEIKSAASALGLKLKEVSDLFRVDAFSGVVSRMAPSQSDMADIAAAREDGLREVRRIKRLMSAHPLLARLMKPQYPFTQPVLPIAELNAALWDVETNLSISG